MTIWHIANDTFLAILLLFSLEIVHRTLYVISASSTFKSIFTRFHETVFLGIYVLIALSGLLHILELMHIKKRIGNIVSGENRES